MEPIDLSRFIYLEHSGTLPERIDYAWGVYIDEAIDDTYRRQAMKFLVYAFDIQLENFSIPESINFELIFLMDNSTQDILEQQISQRMVERETWKALLPDYVPGKTPNCIHQLITTQHEHSIKTLADRLSTELLHVNDYSKEKDKQYNTRFFTPYERSPLQVHIRGGLFYQNAALFDSKRYIAHNKKHFAGFTLNSNGELSVFSHLNMTNRMAHSSIHAGAPVFCAGELCIEEGVLKAITTHSGHYTPNMYSMYLFLEYVAERGVDISQTKVLTFNDPSLAHPIASKRHSTHARHFEVNAEEIYKNYEKTLSNSIDTIHQALLDIYQNREQRARPLWLSTVTPSWRTPKNAALKESKKNFEQDFLSSLQWIKAELIQNRIDLDQATQLLSYTIDIAKAQHAHLYTQSTDATTLGALTSTIDSFKGSFLSLNQEKNRAEQERNSKIDALKKMH